MSGDEPLSTETQLAVIRVQLDQLIDLSKTRGQDHETRLRRLEERKFPLPTIAALVSVAAIVLTLLQYVKLT